MPGHYCNWHYSIMLMMDVLYPLWTAFWVTRSHTISLPFHQLHFCLKHSQPLVFLCAWCHALFHATKASCTVAVPCAPTHPHRAVKAIRICINEKYICCSPNCYQWSAGHATSSSSSNNVAWWYYKGEESAPDLTTEQCDGMERGQIKGEKMDRNPFI